MKNTVLQDRFGKEKRWVAFRIEDRKGKKTKIPYSVVTGKMASSTGAETWATFSKVEAALKKAPDAYHGLGIVFTPEQNLLGIDIDHVVEGGKILGEFGNVAKLVAEADTYTELSPSGTGLHLFFELSDPLKLTANKKAPFEAYTSGRYFTVTQDSFGDVKPVRTVTSEEALAILESIGYPWKKTKEAEEVKRAELPASASVSKLSDEEVLDKLFKSKNGIKARSLYDGDLSDHRDDASAADLSLCSHLAFWTAKDAEQIERIWVSSPLGDRKKTQERADYRKRTIDAAIASCQEVYESRTMQVERTIAEEAPELELMSVLNKEKEKVFIQNTENMCRILRAHPAFRGRFRYDVFKNVLEIKPLDMNVWRPFEDNDAVNTQTRIQVMFPPFAKVGKDMVYDAMIKVAKENTIDSAADWLRSLVWDSESRLDHWLRHTYGVADDEYHRKVGSNWLKGLVKRLIEPGCKFDYVLVLEGRQGIKKSTSLYVLGDGWHVETTMATDSKDFFMQFSGKAIIEFSEGETLSRTEVKRMKAIITMQMDKYRPPYERVSQDFPRRCVFAMTTNQEQYLKDETGNRRWLPVACQKPADVEWLRENREQIFAEAYHRVITLGETTWEFPEEETARQQAMRQLVDPREEQIYEWYYTRLGDGERAAGITTRMAYIQGIQNGSAFGKEMTKLEEIVVSSILRDGLKLEKRRVMHNGSRFNRYFETEESLKLAPPDKQLASFDLEETPASSKGGVLF